MESLQTKNKFTKISLVLVILIIVLGAIGFVVYKYYEQQKAKQIEVTKVQMYAAYDAGDTDKTIIFAQQLLNENPQNIDNLIGLGDAYLNKGSIDHQESIYAPKALDIAEQVIAKDPNNYAGYRIKGYALEITEKFNEAIIAYNKSIELNSSDSKVYNSRGHVYELSGQYDKAKADYLKAYELNTSDTNVMMNLARTYQNSGDDVKAEEFANKIINAGGNSLAYVRANAYSILGQIYLNEGKEKDAIDAFSNSVTVLPSFVLGYVGRAQTLISASSTLDSNKKNQVINDLNKAIELDPHFTWSYFFFGEFYNLEKDKTKAVTYYQKALENVDADLSIGVTGKDPMKKFFQNTINKIKI